MAYLVKDTLTGRVVRTFARTRLADASYMASELNRRETGRYVVKGWGVDRYPPVPTEPTLPVDFS